MYFGAVERSAALGETTAQLWDRIRDVAAANGLDRPGVDIVAVNQLRAAAGSIVRAGDTLATADRTSPVDSSMVGVAPWARELGARTAAPMFQVRFEHLIQTDGAPSAAFRTVMFRGQLPANAGDLADALELDAANMADNYGVEHVGIANVSVLVI